MKKRTKILCAALTATVTAGSAIALASCNKPLTDEPLTGSTIADFTQGEADAFFASDGWCNGDVFNVTWSGKNVAYENEAAKLSISDAAAAAEIPYFGGELRSYQHFGYGDYSVRMKPAKIAGTASTFFTYTGPSELDDDGNENPHDEIDIEFLGKNTTKVQFNYFVNGVGGHEYMYDLGFDASLEYHDYGFRWTEEYIVWFVDGKPVYKVEASAKNPLPSTPGRILMNHWCGTEKAEGWMDKYTGSNGITSDYASVKTSATPIGEIPDKEEVGDLTIPTEGWEDIDYSGFGWNNGYTIDKTDGLTMSHDAAVSEWACEGMTLTKSYSWVKFTIKNNTAVPAAVRMDFKKDGGANAVLAVLPDDAGASVTVESVAMINLGANQSLDLTLKMKDMYMDAMVMFLNSVAGSNESATGSITITDLKGIVNENVEAPETPEPVDPVIPDGDNVALNFASQSGYTVDTSGEASAKITVTYDEIGGATYANIQANAAEHAADKNTFSLKITNNGDKEVLIRVDLIGERKVTVGNNPDMECCNLSAVFVGDATGASGLYTDTEWGGTKFNLAAGASVELVITYSNENEMGAAQRVQLYCDSTNEADRGQGKVYAGNVTFENFKFANVSSASIED